MTKKTILTTTISLIMAASINSAQAGAIATAFIDTSNFIISKNATGTAINNGTDISALVFNSNASAGASLTGFGPITTGTVNSSTPGIGIDLYQSLGSVPGAYTQNDYTSKVFSSGLGDPTANFAFGDQLEINAPITGITGASLGSHLYNESTASIVNIGESGGTSNNGLVSNWTFTALTGDYLTFDFDIAIYLESFVSNGLLAPSTANSAASQIIRLVDLSNPFVNLISDPLANLVFNTGVNSPADNGAPDFLGAGLGTPFTQHITFASANLTAGHEYRLTANTLTSASVVSVPEPGMLALIGAGLLALSGMRKRKNV